jgi:class II lanthipeptide synthase
MPRDDVRGHSWRLGLTAAERRQARPGVPEWARHFVAAYGANTPPTPWPSDLTNAVLPLADSARKNLRAWLAALHIAPSPAEARDALIRSFESILLDRLFDATSSILVLELGVASERGLLKGSSPADRYAFFCACLSDQSFAGRLLAQYPCLVRRLVTLTAQWEDATHEMLTRLSDDARRIGRQIFNGEELGTLIGVESLGDLHACSRSVHRLVFSSGRQIIYKPRPIALERCIFNLFQWLNTSGLTPDVMAAFALDRHSYGWVSHIDAAPCADDAAVRRFFRRQGSNLAVAYLLGAADLHYENVIASGEYPVIVDLETLFHVTPSGTVTKGATAIALDMLGNSVSRTMMLPARIYGDESGSSGRRSADVSALGYAAGQEAPFMGQDWEDQGTDAMRRVDKRFLMPFADCLPELNGERIPATKHVDDIVCGFGDAYDIFFRHRGALKKTSGGLLSMFRGRFMRHVFRPTSQYVQLLGQSWHPRYARDTKLLESYLHSHLSASDPVLSSQRALLKAEITDLMNGDVPCFRAKVGERIAISPTQPRRRARLPSEGWHACQQRVAALGRLDKERQIWLIRMSFVDLKAYAPRTRVKYRIGNRAKLNAAAKAVGDRLCELAIVGAGGASWAFPTVNEDGHLMPGTVGFDLYDGLSGIALFLGRLSYDTGVARYREMAIAAINEALLLYRSMPAGGTPVGAYDGTASLAYVLALLSSWLARPDWALKSAEMVRRNARDAVKFAERDLISGSAGFLLAGIAIAETIDDPSLLKLLRPCAQVLQATPRELLPKDADAGMAHGKAGIGFALARWAQATRRAGSSRTTRVLFEADLTVSERARSEPAGPHRTDDGPSMIAWCRGGLGVAQAALRLQMPVTPMIRHLVRDMKLALTKGSNRPSLCLCHGLFGAIEFFEMARARNVPGADAVYQSIRGEALGRIFDGELNFGHWPGLESPGLMTGMAGTGYALLRMLNPRDVPSVLTFEHGR